jgi:hypothetical protein
MKPTFNTNMFESIKSALENAKNKQGDGPSYKNILQIAAPATYVVRLLPNVKTPSETFMHYYHHGWNSISTGKYFSVTSPSTWGERCPVSELYFKILREGSDDEKNRAKEHLKRKENWMVNVYVVNDPKNPENNGTVKVLRYGRQLNKIIEAAISGDDAAEYGAKIFDLSENGCNLRIKAELVSDKPGAPKYPTYTASKFLTPSAIEGLDEDKINEIYQNIHDLQSFLDHKTADDIKEIINVHFYGTEAAVTESKPTPVAEEDVPYEEPKAPVKVVSSIKTVSPAPKAESAKATKPAETKSNDDAVMAILNGLEDL